jgi:hypothetical protein
MPACRLAVVDVNPVTEAPPVRRRVLEDGLVSTVEGAATAALTPLTVTSSREPANQRTAAPRGGRGLAATRVRPQGPRRRLSTFCE